MQAEHGTYATVEELARAGVRWLELAVELAGAVVIGVGVLLAIAHFLRSAFRGARTDYVGIRLLLAHYLALALEFLLAADVLATAISPSWDQIGKLAAIAAIRTVLNVFLTREMEQADRQIRPGDSPDLPG